MSEEKTPADAVGLALRDEHLRRALHAYTTRTVPALNIDAYAQEIYETNRTAGL